MENPLTKLNSIHDLTVGDREYLKRKEITADHFDELDVQSQHDWKDECVVGAYEKNDYDNGYVKKGGSGAILKNSFTMVVPQLPWKK